MSCMIESKKEQTSGFYYADYDMDATIYINGQVAMSQQSGDKRYFENKLKKHGIEFRRGNAGGGNQLRQPYLKPYLKNFNLSNFKEVDHIHFFGYYIGNYPSLDFIQIRKLVKILNSI